MGVLALEYNKKIPYMYYHVIYWIFCLINEIIIVIFGILLERKLTQEAKVENSAFNWLGSGLSLILYIILITITVIKR